MGEMLMGIYATYAIASLLTIAAALYFGIEVVRLIRNARQHAKKRNSRRQLKKLDWHLRLAIIQTIIGIIGLWLSFHIWLAEPINFPHQQPFSFESDLLMAGQIGEDDRSLV